MPLQAKLLRALQEKEIRPIGSIKRIPITARFIAASNRHLEEGVMAGTFRQDLFFRLNVLQIWVPPLRERRTDIPLLVTYFLEKFSDTPGRTRGISVGALQRLTEYNWPGNIRELQNAIESAVALSSNTVLTESDFILFFEGISVASPHPANELVPPAQLKRRAMLHALRETGGNMQSSARLRYR
jgi:transcriptional regulator with PAS, ATPase and Fis domain